MGLLNSCWLYKVDPDIPKKEFPAGARGKFIFFEKTLKFSAEGNDNRGNETRTRKHGQIKEVKNKDAQRVKHLVKQLSQTTCRQGSRQQQTKIQGGINHGNDN